MVIFFIAAMYPERTAVLFLLFLTPSVIPAGHAQWGLSGLRGSLRDGKLCTSAIGPAGSQGRCTVSLACPLLGGRNAGACRFGMGYTCCLFDRCLSDVPSSDLAKHPPVFRRSIGAEVTYQCPEGMLFEDGGQKFSVRCSRQRRWEPARIPSCVNDQSSTCGTPLPTTSSGPSTTSNYTGTVEVGDAVTMLCPENFIFSTSGERFVQVDCVEGGTWSVEVLAGCVPDPCSESPCGDGTCDVVCQPGSCTHQCTCGDEHMLQNGACVPADSAECLTMLGRFGSQGRCMTAAQCPLAGGIPAGVCDDGRGYVCCAVPFCQSEPPENGLATHTTQQRYPIGINLLYRCPEGTRFVGGRRSMRVRCNRRAQWRPASIPNCQLEYDDMCLGDPPSNGLATYMGEDSHEVGSVLTYQCPDGMVFDLGAGGQVTTRCNQRGLWQPSILPDCVVDEFDTELCGSTYCPEDCSQVARIDDCVYCKCDASVHLGEGEIAVGSGEPCPEGYIKVREDFATNICFQLPVSVGCSGLPPSPPGPDVESNHTGMVAQGSSAVISCPDNHVFPSGQDTMIITCGAGGQWSLELLPPCLTDPCTADVCSLGTCQLSCTTTECTPNCICAEGQTLQDGVCVAVVEEPSQCPPPLPMPIYPPGITSNYTGEAAIGEMVQVMCPAGHLFPDGSSSMVVHCETGGQWSVNFLPTCLPNPCHESPCGLGECMAMCSMSGCSHQCVCGDGQLVDGTCIADIVEPTMCMSSLPTSDFGPALTSNYTGDVAIGESVMISCPSGFVFPNTESYMLIDCSPGGVWSPDVLPSCLPDPCRESPCGPGVCTVSCSSLSCDHQCVCGEAAQLQDGTCVDAPEQCSSELPVGDDYAVMAGDWRRDVGDVVVYRCLLGMMFADGSEVVKVNCTADLQWEPSHIPNCVPEPCPMVVHPCVPGVCTRMCDGTSCRSQCTCPGGFTDTNSSCTPEPTKCSDSPPSGDGHVTQSGGSDGSVGSDVTYECPEGMMFSDGSREPITAVCQDDQIWHPTEIPDCVQDPCLQTGVMCSPGVCSATCNGAVCHATCRCPAGYMSHPTSCVAADQCVNGLPSGDHHVSHTTPSGLSMGTTVTFTCPLSMRFEDGQWEVEVTCRNDRMWHPSTIPDCVDVDDDPKEMCVGPLPEPLTGPPITSNFTGSALPGDSVMVMCPHGFLFPGGSDSLRITCDGDMEWSESALPACSENPCLNSPCGSSPCEPRCMLNTGCTHVCTCQPDFVRLNDGCVPDPCGGNGSCGDGATVEQAVCDDAGDCYCLCECGAPYDLVNARCVMCRPDAGGNIPEGCPFRPPGAVHLTCHRDIGAVRFRLLASFRPGATEYRLTGDILHMYEPRFRSMLYVLETDDETCPTTAPDSGGHLLSADVQQYRYTVELTAPLASGDQLTETSLDGSTILLTEGLVNHVTGCCQLQRVDATGTGDLPETCTQDNQCWFVRQNTVCMDRSCLCDELSFSIEDMCVNYVTDLYVIMHYYLPDKYEPGDPTVQSTWPLECAGNSVLVGIADRESANDLDYIKCGMLAGVTLVEEGSVFNPDNETNSSDPATQCAPDELAVAIWDDSSYFTSVDRVKCRRLADGHVTNTCVQMALPSLMVADPDRVENARNPFPAQCPRDGLWGITQLVRQRALWTSMTCCRVTLQNHGW